MQTLVLQLLLLLSPGAKKVPLASRIKISTRQDVTIKPYNPSYKPPIFYLQQLNENAIRQHLHINTKNIREEKARMKKLDNPQDAFVKETVSYAEILANLKTMEEWKATQQKIRTGEVRNVQMAKLRMEENIRKQRLELVKKMGTPEEYREELDAYRNFEEFKTRFLKNKEVSR